MEETIDLSPIYILLISFIMIIVGMTLIFYAHRARSHSIARNIKVDMLRERLTELYIKHKFIL